MSIHETIKTKLDSENTIKSDTLSLLLSRYQSSNKVCFPFSKLQLQPVLIVNEASQELFLTTCGVWGIVTTFVIASVSSADLQRILKQY